MRRAWWEEVSVVRLERAYLLRLRSMALRTWKSLVSRHRSWSSQSRGYTGKGSFTILSVAPPTTRTRRSKQTADIISPLKHPTVSACFPTLSSVLKPSLPSSRMQIGSNKGRTSGSADMYRPRKYSRYPQGELGRLEEMKSREADSSSPHSLNNNDEEIQQLRTRIDQLSLVEKGYVFVLWNRSVC